MEIITPDKRIAAVVLAAGMSRRMGRLKPLLPFGGQPMLVRVIESLQQANEIQPIIVVTGYAADQVVSVVQRSTLHTQNIMYAHNENYATGEMLSSVQMGVQALPEHIAAFLLVLGDQPGVLPSTIEALCHKYHETGAPIITPSHNGRQGHPLLIAAECAAEILSLAPDATLRDFVQRHRDERIEVDVADSAVIADVDTPEDYETALRLWHNSSQ